MVPQFPQQSRALKVFSKEGKEENVFLEYNQEKHPQTTPCLIIKYIILSLQPHWTDEETEVQVS